MIYLVSNNHSLFSPEHYKTIDMKEALSILEPLSLIQLDTETSGLDCHTKDLLTVQLGNRDNQVVIDWTTISQEDKLSIKDLLENPAKTYLGWNLSFDCTFLYVQGIYPKSIIDGMIIEKLIFLGYPSVLNIDLYDGQFGYQPILDNNGNIKHYELSYSLKASAKRWCNIDIDKTVRGQIISKGLTEDVVVYVVCTYIV